jgi:hypothetical protein
LELGSFIYTLRPVFLILDRVRQQVLTFGISHLLVG